MLCSRWLCQNHRPPPNCGIFCGTPSCVFLSLYSRDPRGGELIFRASCVSNFSQMPSPLQPALPSYLLADGGDGPKAKMEGWESLAVLRKTFFAYSRLSRLPSHCSLWRKQVGEREVLVGRFAAPFRRLLARTYCTLFPVACGPLAGRGCFSRRGSLNNIVYLEQFGFRFNILSAVTMIIFLFVFWMFNLTSASVPS